MRITAFVSWVLTSAAFVLAFLILFAGNRPTFMANPNYSIVSLNTSRIGQSILLDVRRQFERDPNKLVTVLRSFLEGILENSNGTNSTRSPRKAKLRRRMIEEGLLSPTPLDFANLLVKRDASGVVSEVMVKGGRVLNKREIEELQKRQIWSTITSAWDSLTSGVSSTWQTVQNAWNTITNPDELFRIASRLMDEFMDELGLEDFYTMHVRSVCEGQFTPIETPNATVPLSAIDRNVTDCQNYKLFKPSDRVQDLLNKTRLNQVGVTLETIRWPEGLDDAVELAVRGLNACKIIYIIIIVFAGLAMIMSIIAFILGDKHLFLQGTILSILSFIGAVLAIAVSAVLTFASRKIKNVIKDKGSDLGIEAQIGNGFLGLTWAMAGALTLAFFVGIWQCCCNGIRKRRKSKRVSEQKYG